ncbi:activator-dependent family glycosyltransferase [Streptomyces griseus]|uniref:activator-dependent family glycosyltransferase n=1 Tax=Streptomyces griseus TaxID=1911 RepID=UPI00056C5732|nr:activator-dependent family glycosyltransferase [Streptomyces griseus]
MRVLLTSFAMDAHFGGLVPLAWALRNAGHDVRVASHPAMTDGITGAGLTAVAVGRDHTHDAMLRRAGAGIFAFHQDPDYLENRHERLDLEFLKGHDTIMTGLFYSQMNDDALIDDLVDFARFWQPDLVIWEPFTFAGAVAARVTGAAHARILSFPDLFQRARQVFFDRLSSGPAEHHEDSIREWLTWTLARFGHSYDETMTTGDWSIDQMPPSIRLTPTGLTVPMRYVPYNGLIPTVVPDWLRDDPGRPRVCVTLGLTVRKTDFPNAVSVDEVCDAIADLDVEVVATLDATEQENVGTVPDNVRIVEHVPLDALLPTCTAIVHHGGAGTWATAAAHGVPQVALGWIWDAVYRARRLEELGAGLHLGSAELTAEGLRGKLVRLLKDDAFTVNAGHLREEILAAPAPNDIVPTLEALTVEHRC